MSLPRDPRLVVVALGGKALHGPGGRSSPEAWTRAIGRSLAPLVDLVAAGFRLVLAHGCRVPGSEAALGRVGTSADAVRALDLRGAEAQGAAGYALAQALGSLCRGRGVEVPIAAVVTRVSVDADDPAFRRASVPVGPPYSPAQARRLGRERGWTFAGPATRARRRIVPAPRPLRVLEADAIHRLADAGVIPVAAGAGVPVVETPDGYRGVEAILREDATAALLGTALGAERLVFATGVDQVEVGHRTARAIGVERLSVGEARAFLKAREFPSATMGAKIEAAIEFVEAGGREAIITSLAVVRAALDGRGGTRIVP